MTASTLLMFAFRPRVSIKDALRIAQRSLQQRSIYRSLLQEHEWHDLSDKCIHDIRGVHGEILCLTGAMAEVRALRNGSARTIKVLTQVPGALKAAELPETEFDTDALNAEALRTLLKDALYPRGVFASAHELLCLQSAAFQCLVDADLNQALVESRGSTAVAALVDTFWGNPIPRDLVVSVRRYRRALNRWQNVVYLSAVGDRSNLFNRLSQLIDWIGQSISGLIAVQSTITALLAHSDAHNHATVRKALISLIIDTGTLMREMMASYLSGVISMLSLKGSHHLRHGCNEVFSRARVTAFQGKVHVGKRSSIGRLRRLPDGMLVRIEGTLAALEFVRGNDGGYSVGQIVDASGEGSISIVASANLVTYGLRTGSHLRLSGYFRKTGSSVYRQEHLEAQRLLIDKGYGEEIWKLAFLNLCSPYFEYWPSNYHVEFTRALDREGVGLGDGVNDAHLSGAKCDDELEKLEDAENAHYQAILSQVQSNLLVAGAVIALHAACFTPVIVVPVLCAGATTAVLAALTKVHLDAQKTQAAEGKLARAQKAYDDCIFPLTGEVGPYTGHIGPSVDWGHIATDDSDDWWDGDDGGGGTDDYTGYPPSYFPETDSEVSIPDDDSEVSIPDDDSGVPPSDTDDPSTPYDSIYV